MICCLKGAACFVMLFFKQFYILIMFRCATSKLIIFLSLNFIFFLLFSCNQKAGSASNGFSLTPGKSFSFPLTYPVKAQFTRMIDNKDGGKIFCSYNSKTFKRIDLFTLDGKVLKTVPLNDILVIENSIGDIMPVSVDSFWILANYSNNLYLINSAGNILKQIRINASPVDSLRMEVRGSVLSDFQVNNNTFLFSCTYYYKNKEAPYTLSSYFKMNKAQPYFLKVESPFDSMPAMTFGLPGFYNRIFKNPDAMCVEGALYVPVPNGILLTSWYTDSLFLINDQDFSVKKAIKLSSRYSTIGCTPLTTQEFQNDSRALNVLLRQSGGILSVNYDPFRDLIYVVIREQAAKDATEPSSHKSLLVYDSSLHLKDEVKLDCKKYDLSEMYVLKEGLLINKIDETHDNDSKFQLFYVGQK